MLTPLPPPRLLTPSPKFKIPENTLETYKLGPE